MNIARHTLQALCAALIAYAVAAPAHAIGVGDQAENFKLPGLDRTVKLSDSKGKLVYLDFWASWCGSCRQSFPWMNELARKYSAQGLEIIAVNLDARNEDARKFLSETPASFTIAFDPKGTTPKQYDVKGMPTSALIGKDGRIVFKHVGFNHNSRDEMEKAIQDALGVKP
jgi:thiol-disulfide isomerase/thioredoxin